MILIGYLCSIIVQVLNSFASFRREVEDPADSSGEAADVGVQQRFDRGLRGRAESCASGSERDQSGATPKREGRGSAQVTHTHTRDTAEVNTTSVWLFPACRRCLKCQRGHLVEALLLLVTRWSVV